MTPQLPLVAVLFCLALSVVAEKCIGWRQTSECDPDQDREEDGDKDCKTTIHSGSSGYCECANNVRAGYVTCKHEQFTCEETCQRTNVLGYLEDTVWEWNSWRNVEFRSGGIFFAPEYYCRDGVSCAWSIVNGNTIAIDWSGAGMHTVKLSADRRSMEGQRYDGDKCSGVFQKRDTSAGDERHKKQRAENGADDDEDDLYNVLGVDPDAQENDIKKVYRRLSRKYHPDKNRNNPEAAVMFEKIREAYEVVGDPDKRILYDTGGLESVRDAEKQDNSGGGGGHDPFAAFFGGGQQQQGRQAKKGNDARVELKVSLEDMYNGNTVAASISRRIVCRGCKNGGKGKNKARCKSCGRCPNEVKTVLRQMAPGFNVQQQEEVPSKHRCKDEKTTLNAVVEKGMDNNAEIKFERMSEQRPGMIPGDVIMVIKQKPHRTFRREGNDLHLDLVVTLKEALVGFDKTVTHLDGHEVEVSSHGRVTKPFKIMHLKDEGMPHHGFPSQKGTMHVKIIVQFPPKLNDIQKQFVEEHF
jgi:DnaJ-class molecular chaperone